MTDIYQVTVTVPDEETAGKIARELVERRLAACAQILGPIRSVYRWEGKIEDNPEWMCIIKTTAEYYPAMREAILKIHPYKVPEIAAVKVAAGNPEYLKWVEESVGKE